MKVQHQVHKSHSVMFSVSIIFRKVEDIKGVGKVDRVGHSGEGVRALSTTTNITFQSIFFI